MHVTVSDRNAIKIPDVLTYTVDDDATAGVNLAGFPILGLLVPVCNGTPTITAQITIDGGSTWLNLKDKDGATASVSIAGGATAFFLSSDVLTPLAAYVAMLPEVAPSAQVKVRLALSVAQTADRTFIWIGLG